MLSQYLPEHRMRSTNAPGSQIAGGVSSEIGPRLSAITERGARAAMAAISDAESTMDTNDA
jgi:hypothetical protein